MFALSAAALNAASSAWLQTAVARPVNALPVGLGPGFVFFATIIHSSHVYH
jgi:hypothetical protein